MSDAESEDDVKLYSALERNQKQRKRMFVSLDSDDSDGDSDDTWGATAPKPRRKRKAVSSPPSNGKEKAKKKTAKQTEDDEADDDEDDGVAEVSAKKSIYEDLLTPEELAVERRRKAQIELEISLSLARDKTLSQTRAVMNKVSSFQTQAANEIELLDSDEDGDEEIEIVQPEQKSAAPPANAATPRTAAVVPKPTPAVRGERIKLQVRSNGTAIDEVAIHKNDPFDLLYVSFCDLHGLPRSAVKMVLDGKGLSLTDTPAANDLETGDLIDAKVDFTQRVQDIVKRYVRLRLVVFGKRAEVFRIDARSKVEKLHASFCAKHSIPNPDDVTMSVNGQELDLDEVIEFYGLIDGEEVSVQINNYVDPAAIPLQLRYEDDSSSVEHVLPSDKVQVLLQKIANLKQCVISAITLRIDGESMAPTQAFRHYDLEGDEIIEVKLNQ